MEMEVVPGNLLSGSTDVFLASHLVDLTVCSFVKVTIIMIIMMMTMVMMMMMMMIMVGVAWP